MRNKVLNLVTLAFIGSLAVPALVSAQDAQSEGTEKVSGSVEVGGIIGSGQDDSSKFDEYTARSSGGTGNATLDYSNNTDEHANLTLENIGREDQRYSFDGGRYGEYKVELEYDQILHSFATDYRTLYSGVGTGALELPDSLQSDLQDSISTNDLADRLNNTYLPGADSIDVSLTRKTGKADVVYQGFDPFTVKVETSREERSGTRPLMAGFGFGNVEELTEPLDYETTQARFSLDYVSKDYFFSADYYLSVFQNNEDTLSFDNPLRLTDSTSPTAYLNPSMDAATGTLANKGPGRGLIDLAPNNLYHGPSLAMSAMNLPYKSRLTFNSAWGFMSQDDDLVPYTTNTTAIGMDGTRPFNAASLSELPYDGVDAQVNTQLYNLRWSSRPAEDVDVNLKYRYYSYDNNTDSYHFPGYVRFDSVWEDIAISSHPSSYSKQTAGADLGYDLTDDTRLGLEYSWTGTDRTNREVKSQADNVLGASVDQTFNDWVNGRVSYQKSFRTIGEYDFSQPFGDEEYPPQLPFLRKYDQAERQSDQVNSLVSLSPTEKLDLTAGFIFGQSDYTDSPFGLLDDRFYMLSLDGDYEATSWMKLNAFYSYEQHASNQRSRQWSTLNTAGDPYVLEPDEESNSNWKAANEDMAHTIGGGVTFTILAKELFFDTNYAFTDAYGNVDFSSPIGQASDDANAFIPGGYSQIDHTILQRVNPRFRYKMAKDWQLIVGYLWESFSFGDYTGTGFSNVPTTSRGAYNGSVLGGSWPFADYEVNLAYASVKYRF